MHRGFSIPTQIGGGGLADGDKGDLKGAIDDRVRASSSMGYWSRATLDREPE